MRVAGIVGAIVQVRVHSKYAVIPSPGWRCDPRTARPPTALTKMRESLLAPVVARLTPPLLNSQRLPDQLAEPLR